MNQSSLENQNCEVSKSSYVKQESSVSYGYDTSYMSYTSATTTMNQQPLPGQPPLPPMPPPSTAVPPPPSVFPVQAQIPAAIHAWPAATWQWITPQHPTAPLPAPPQSPQHNLGNFQREMPMRNNYLKRERYNHNNRNNLYQQNFHRKNRRRFDQHNQNHYDQAATNYFNTSLNNNIGIDWQRTSYTGNEVLLNQMQMPMQTQISHSPASVTQGNNRRLSKDGCDSEKDEGVNVKKTKQRKPMSQSYPSRPWNREDAERALKVENEYNKVLKAQSLIIKFPDPELNKDIVREFHSGIQNIHFQNPSGPRYCFIQMAENVNIDVAIKELEKIKFGTGHLKVERKSLREEDNPVPEEIDPYTLYIGNLPESVNVNEVKNKFPTGARVDVGFAQKMRNTRYAFIRYNSVDESIAAYKKAHDLMWDTRSIIVRFRRQRGNTCLPGETNPKKNKNIEASKSSSNDKEKTVEKSNNKNFSSGASIVEKPTVIDLEKNFEENKSLNSNLIKSTDKLPNIQNIDYEEKKYDEEASSFLVDIKAEPEDYEEIDDLIIGEDDDDDDEDEIICHDESSDEDDDDDDNDVVGNFRSLCNESTKDEDGIPSDHLDKMFSDLENIASDIKL